MIRKFLRLWITRAAQDSVTLTDKLTVLIVPFSTLVIHLTGLQMTATIQETLALGVAASVIGVVVLRLLAAPYWIWMDDQRERGRLIHEISLPERQVEAAMKDYAVAVRQQLSEKLAQLVAMTHMASAKIPFGGSLEAASAELLKLDTDIFALTSQLSYDMAVRISVINLRNLCFDLIRSPVPSEDRGPLIERLWKQRKLTFRILHKDHRISELVSLMELEILLEDHGHSLRSNLASSKNSQENDYFDELKRLVREIGLDLHTEEVARKLRRDLREIDAKLD